MGAMNPEKKILVSACLYGGGPYRYDGRDKLCQDPRFRRWQEEGILIPVCPEVLGGLPVPRPPSERRGDRVVNSEGADVTEAYRRGAAEACRIAQEAGCRIAVLKAKSPACGNREIYDGTFSRRLVPGMGVCAQALTDLGLRVFNETELDLAEALIEG